MIAVIASQSIRESVRQLNRRNLFEVQDIDGHAPAELAAELEAGNYQYAIFDLLYFSGDVDLGLLLIRRIVETRPELTLIVVSDSLDEDSLFVEDVIKAGVPKEHIITNRQAGLRQQLLEIFLSDDILKSPAMDTAQPVANNSKGQDVSNSEEVHSEGPLSEGVPQEHPKQLERRAVAPSSRRCISVAVAGAGSGIGCTTQAMQLLLYCRAHGHHPALIEVHSAHSLQDYLGGGKAPNSDIIDETHFIAMEQKPTPEELRACIRSHPEGYDYIPCTKRLAAANKILPSMPHYELVLRGVLRDSGALCSYDYVIIDGLPGDNPLQENILAAADECVIPFQSKVLEFSAIFELAAIIENIRSKCNPALKIVGTVITMYDRTTTARDICEELASIEEFAPFRAMVSRLKEAADAPGYHTSCVASSHSKIGQQYISIANEFLAREGE